MPLGCVVGGDGDGFVDEHSMSKFCCPVEEFNDVSSVDDVDVVGLFYLVVHPDFDDLPVTGEVVIHKVW